MNQFSISPFIITAICVAGTVLSGCAGSPEVADEKQNTEQNVAPSPEFSAPEQLAIDTVAGHLGIDSAAVSLTSSTAVEFNDASLNCPQKGMMYAQVITNGYWVFVAANGQEFDVRIAGDYAQICSTPGNPPRRRKTLSR